LTYTLAYTKALQPQTTKPMTQGSRDMETEMHALPQQEVEWLARVIARIYLPREMDTPTSGIFCRWFESDFSELQGINY
jgi:hypothetical protein